ncbi:hypothetical protein BDD12DRAFT_874190 [Trichophaea hybrida]|nr:hypothetical protein BDD12DRAFT_874190 [Trichophaea hybrida]
MAANAITTSDFLAAIFDGDYSYVPIGFCAGGTPPEVGYKRESEATLIRMAAQMRHYGVEFDPMDTSPGMQETLVAALAMGLFKDENVPDDLLELERSLRDAYTRQNNTRVSTVNDQRNQEFARIYRLVDAANFSTQLFLHRHFLNAAGWLDPTKAPASMRLPGLENHNAVMSATRNIPGIYVATSGLQYDLNYGGLVLILGKCMDSVRATAQTITEAQQARKDEGLQLVAEQRLAGHHRYVQSLGGRRSNPQGKYTVYCDEIDRSCPYIDGEGMSHIIRTEKELTKFAGVERLGGDFNFRTLEGIMRFKRKPGDVKPYEEERRVQEKPGWSFNPSAEARPVPARRFEFSWRGHETGEGEIKFIPAEGVINFTDDTFTKFNSIFNSKYYSTNCIFRGYKIAGPTEVDNIPAPQKAVGAVFRRRLCL